MNTFHKLSREVYKQVTNEVQQKCRKSGIIGSNAISKISGPQQSIRLRTKLALTRELETWFAIAMQNFDEKSARFNIIQTGHKFLVRYISSINEVPLFGSRILIICNCNCNCSLTISLIFQVKSILRKKVANT